MPPVRVDGSISSASRLFGMVSLSLDSYKALAFNITQQLEKLFNKVSVKLARTRLEPVILKLCAIELEITRKNAILLYLNITDPIIITITTINITTAQLG